MPLEASIILLDNSEYAINSDYGNTRWDSQLDATKVVFNAKTGSNPESSVGLMTIAGNSPSVLVSPTGEYGKLAVALNSIKLHGESDIVTGINVAQLALKHRQNKNQRQRVIVFVGSPIEASSAADLVRLGKKLKKNNVAVDVISFGEDNENEEKLREFIDSVNSSDNSHLVSVPAGTVLLSDMILSSSMLSEDGIAPPGGGSGAGASGGEDGEYGVDPNLDPELAMALRMSLEEERARMEAANRNQAVAPVAHAGGHESAASPVSGSAVTEAAATTLTADLSALAASGPAAAQPMHPATETAAVGPTDKSTESAQIKEEAMDEDEDTDLAMALALSRGEDAAMDDAGEEDQGDDEEGLTEEEAIARAIAMSMKDQEEPDKS